MRHKDGAVGTVNQTLRDRSEEHCLESAASARANHQQIGIAAGLGQRVRRVAVEHNSRDATRSMGEAFLHRKIDDELRVQWIAVLVSHVNDDQFRLV